MRNPIPAKKKKINVETAKLLLDAAAAEFNERGYQHTDTNRIARRAGFAPQTFYRWYQDKSAIFIEVYRQWQLAEAETLGGLLKANASSEVLVDACVDHHRANLRFRRSLRQLSYDDPLIRKARAASRLMQIEFIRSWNSALSSPGAVAAALLQLERLSDALAEGEFEDMGLSDGEGRAALADIINKLRARS